MSVLAQTDYELQLRHSRDTTARASSTNSTVLQPAGPIPIPSSLVQLQETGRPLAGKPRPHLQSAWHTKGQSTYSVLQAQQ
jgi:hypothetical protein